MMKKTIATIAALFALLICATGMASQPDRRGPTETVAEENSPEMVEILRVRIENKQDAPMTASDDGGATWRQIGRTLMPAGALNKQGYTASGWAQNGRVAATAVNAVHVRVRQTEDGHGVLFSILPKEMYEKPADYKSYFSKNSSIITSMPAGTGFFGGDESPFIGSPVYVEKAGGLEPLPADYYINEGDSFVIVIQRPVKYPTEIVFENRFGGFITAVYKGGETKIIGQVLKPVAGTGRFDGSMYTDVGRIRANHTGVVCISTTPRGPKGGFQIIPENHAMSPEMKNARLLTQWMVVGAPSVTDPSLEGVAPLFQYFLRPTYHPPVPGRSIEDALDSFLVEARMSDGPWRRLPVLEGRLDDSLVNMTHLRILFPLETPDWLK